MIGNPHVDVADLCLALMQWCNDENSTHYAASLAKEHCDKQQIVTELFSFGLESCHDIAWAVRMRDDAADEQIALEYYADADEAGDRFVELTSGIKPGETIAVW